MSCLLRTNALGKNYGAICALSDVNFEIAAGELVGLVGDNGAGKSTFVKALAGAVQPSTGSVEVDGTPVRLRSPVAARELGIETVYQDFGLCDNLSVAENVYLGREPTTGWGPLRRLDWRRMREEVVEMLSTVSINVPEPAAPVAELSGGQRQAVALSRCRLWRSRLVLLDEPAAALGVQESARVIDAIGQLAADGAAIVLISHDIPTVLELTNRIAVLRKGTKVADVRTAEVSEHDVVALITGARETNKTKERA